MDDNSSNVNNIIMTKPSSIWLRSFVRTAIVCLALTAGMRLFAAPAAAGSLLQQAYTALEQADHDYKGHRVAAMKQVEAAGKALGLNLRGQGKGHEKQGISDEQLRTAQTLLEEARAELSGKPLKHVNRALSQINTALKIK